jgi:lipopolysaccharide/colanic/teichoic acid biosynthesis glycosyltransferase
VAKDTQKKTFSDLQLLGTYDDIPEVLRNYGVQEIIFALNERSHDELLRIVATINTPKVVFKIIPEFYDVVSGHKTEEIAGHPLLRLFPDHMQNWQWMLKRLIDILTSIFLFIITLPAGLFFYFLLLIESPFQKAFRIIDIVGKEGKVYGMLNYNVKEGQKGIHKVLYKTNLYKFPVLINIIMGKMSLVGPRPETPDEVKLLQSKIRFYNRRFQIRPGLTGWAQVKYRYDESLKSKREQYKQDLFYLENMSLTFDLRIIIRSVYILFFKR